MSTQRKPPTGFDTVERQYGVKYFKGQHVIAHGKPGVITGCDGQYLQIKVEGLRHSNNYHPTDNIASAVSQ